MHILNILKVSQPDYHTLPYPTYPVTEMTLTCAITMPEFSVCLCDCVFAVGSRTLSDGGRFAEWCEVRLRRLSLSSCPWWETRTACRISR